MVLQAEPSSARQPEKQMPVYWITGLHDSGKSTFARALRAVLTNRNVPTVLIESDVYRKFFGSRFDFSREDRRMLASIYAQICENINRQGLTVICSTVSLFEDQRRRNRAQLPFYYEIYIRVNHSDIVERHPRGLFAAAKAGRVKNVPGIDQYAELPKNPDWVIDNDGKMNLGDLSVLASNIADETIVEQHSQ